jgi:hypothetical protein
VRERRAVFGRAWAEVSTVFLALALAPLSARAGSARPAAAGRGRCPRLLDTVRALPAYRALRDRLPAQGERRAVRSLPGSSGAVVAAALAGDFPQRVILVVTGSPGRAERWHSDLSVLLEEAARFYPQREALGEEEPHYEIAGERVETLEAVLRGRTRIVVTTLRATMERSRMPEAIVRARLDLARGGLERPQAVTEQLERMGYERVPSVTDVAQFAVRGGIVDVYGFGMAAPVRIEWWGDEILSIRAFDLDSQRSEREIGRVTVLPVAALRRSGGQAVASTPDIQTAQPPNRLTAERPRHLPPTPAIVDEGVAETPIGCGRGGHRRAGPPAGRVPGQKRCRAAPAWRRCGTVARRDR